MEECQLTNFTNNKEVLKIIESKNHLELAKYIGRELCNFTENDENYIDMFWDAAFNKSWLYVSDEIVNGQFGYKKSKDMMKVFYDKLVKEFDNKTDYKTVNKDNNIVFF